MRNHDTLEQQTEKPSTNLVIFDTVSHSPSEVVNESSDDQDINKNMKN